MKLRNQNSCRSWSTEYSTPGSIAVSKEQRHLLVRRFLLFIIPWKLPGLVLALWVRHPVSYWVLGFFYIYSNYFVTYYRPSENAHIMRSFAWRMSQSTIFSHLLYKNRMQCFYKGQTTYILVRKKHKHFCLYIIQSPPPVNQVFSLTPKNDCFARQLQLLLSTFKGGET